jgi:ribosomal protein L11 methylase PrmA
MSTVYARKSILARIDRTITNDSSKESDGKFLQEACSISDYYSVEFKYVKTRMENKYSFKFKDYYKRSYALEQWDKIKDTLFFVQKSDTKTKKSAKPKVITENDWTNSSKNDLSPAQALYRFNKLKAEEKKQRLLEEVRNVDLLFSN